MHGCLHDDIKMFPCARLCIYERIVAPLDPENDLEQMAYSYMATFVFVGEMHNGARSRQFQVRCNRPWPRTHDGRCGFGFVGAVDEAVERGVFVVCG